MRKLDHYVLTMLEVALHPGDSGVHLGQQVVYLHSHIRLGVGATDRHG